MRLNEIYKHPVIVLNPYTKWFKRGEANEEQVKDLLKQFSVFSLQFKAIQAKRMVNANNIESELEAWGILVSELGGDSNIWKSEGGRIIRKNSHIEWLRDTAEVLQIARNDLGRWYIANRATKEFLNGLDSSYGSPNWNCGAGASFAIESLSGFGIGKGKRAELNNFWKELIIGLEKFNQKRKQKDLPQMDLGFFQYHFELERQHVDSVERELEKTCSDPDFNENDWFIGARLALQSIYIFWCGLDEARKTLI